MRSIKNGMIIFAVVLTAGWVSAAVNFTGADPGNNLFSSTNNWDVFPSAGSALGWLDNTDAGNPAQLDAAFNSLVSNFGNSTITTPGAGTAYVEVLDGATLRTVNLYIGNVNQPTRGGEITFDAGSVLMPHTWNSGAFRIGVKGAGTVVARDGMDDFGFANMELGTNGVLVFEFSSNSVSTFVSTRSNGAANMILDGLIRVDLTAMPEVGTYPLIQCSYSNTVLSGELVTWLSGLGGSFSSSGSYENANFEVFNGGNTEWTFQISSNTLELVINTQGHYLSETATQDTSVRSTATTGRADLGGADTLFVDGDGGIRGILEFDLSGVEQPITNAALTMTQTADRTGAWTFDVYPMVYTTNNYSWYEGTGTWIFANNEASPAASNGAACYLYSADDPVTPVQWEDDSGSPLANAKQSALWGASISSVSGSNSVSGQQIIFALDASVLESFRTNGVGRITIGIWGTDDLDGNHFYASKDHATADWRPKLDLLMSGPEVPPSKPVITSISLAAVGGNNEATVVFDAEADASLWFTPDLVSPIWTNVVSGMSPLSHTNNSPIGFYKVTIP